MPIRGIIALPGDKSISHRSLMLSSLSDGVCIINNLSTGKDVESTRVCLEQCGIKIESNHNIIKIEGGKFTESDKVLNCGNSGTTVRLLLGLLAGKGISAEFAGDISLSSRPMDRIIKPLAQMGVSFESNNGYLPIRMMPGKLKNISYHIPVASAQVKSSILLAALGAPNRTLVYEPIKTRDHTEIMLKKLGADIKIDHRISISKLINPLSNFEITIPGDPSSAAFFAGLAAIVPNSDITINNILANPSRIGFFNLLEKMGAGVEWNNIHSECGELVGDVHVYYQSLNGVNINEDIVPSIIDELPILAIVASQADGPTIVSGASELRIKESDRITAICSNLFKMGCNIIEKKDGFIIDPIKRLYGTDIRTYGDHRIAMAFTIASYVADSLNILDDKECINISFPQFDHLLKNIIK